jgi:hypothetical protein
MFLCGRSRQRQQCCSLPGVVLKWIMGLGLQTCMWGHHSRLLHTRGYTAAMTDWKESGQHWSVLGKPSPFQPCVAKTVCKTLPCSWSALWQGRQLLAVHPQQYAQYALY